LWWPDAALKKIDPTAQIGIAKNNIYFEPHGRNPLNHVVKKIYDQAWNFYFLNRIQKHQDFIGLNYYFHNRINWGFIKNENKLVSDLGWELHPEGIYHVLNDLKHYHKPIYITENGLADEYDRHRTWFIKQILRYVHQAIAEGTDVRGYLHWSLIDNFEWDKGFYPRFGLVKIDYTNHARIPRPSAYFFQNIAKNNSLYFD
jgi:beta-glucosidase/6-phospho-beta-glucosidase/beta-galactosidase